MGEGCKRCGRGPKTPNIQFEKPKYSNVNDPLAARCSNCNDGGDKEGGGGWLQGTGSFPNVL